MSTTTPDTTIPPTDTVYEFDEGSYQDGMLLPKRFRRPKIPVDTQINDEVIEILELLYRYKYLNSKHIEMHLPHRSAIWLRNRLQRMFMAHLVDRPRDQIHYGLGEFLIYSLNKRGFVELENATDLGTTVTPDYGTMRMADGKEFRHSLMICETLSNIELGARKNGVRFLSWADILPDGEKFEFKASYDYELDSGKVERITNHKVRPDGFFGLHYPEGKVAYFALEAQITSPNRPDGDKRAATRSSAKKKFLSYGDIVRRRLYKPLGIGNLRVLVTAPSATKLTNLFDVLGDLQPGGSQVFLGNVVPPYGANYNRPRPNPDLFDAPWMRAKLPPEYINAPTLRS